MASLPSNSFMFNYNAKEYDAVTHTFPKTQGQLFDEDIVLNKAPSSYGDDYVYFGSSKSYMVKSYCSSSQNPISRSNSLGNSFTFIYKTSGFTSAYENLVANRDNSNINWEVRGEIFHTATVFNLRMTPSSHPQIGMIRVFSDGSCEKRFLDDNGNTLQVTTESNVNWGNLTYGFGVFVGGSNFISEYFTQHFYWMYCSFETLTDAEIQQVINYNEKLGSFGIEPENILFSYTGGTSALTITAEEGWTASTSDSWLTLSSTSGTGNSTINVTAQLNKGQERTGSITVTDGNTNVSCTITQSKYPVLLYCENLFKNGNAINKICMGNVVLRENLYIFNVDMNEIEFEKSGATEQVAINSTKVWTATAPNWITLSSYSGRSGNITITVASADTSRDGNIVIDNGVNQKIITVNQIVPSYELDLNNGEWIANGEVEVYTLYESTNNGKDNTTCTCYLKFTGQSATLMVKTDGEDYYDYVVIENFDTGSSFWSGRGQTHNMYHTVVCNYNTNGVHTIAIKYRKDGSVNNYTDKGYFYIKEIA